MFEVKKIFASSEGSAEWAKKYFPGAEVEIRKVGWPGFKAGDSDRYVFEMSDGEKEIEFRSCMIGVQGYPDEVLACVPLRRWKSLMKRGKVEAIARRLCYGEIRG